MKEKRQYNRKKKLLKSEVHSNEGMTFSSTVDISTGGIFISTPEPLVEGTEIQLSLHVPGEDEVNITGVVRWVRGSVNDDVKSGMGIEFINTSENDISTIKKIIK